MYLCRKGRRWIHLVFWPSSRPVTIGSSSFRICSVLLLPQQTAFLFFVRGGVISFVSCSNSFLRVSDGGSATPIGVLWLRNEGVVWEAPGATFGLLRTQLDILCKKSQCPKNKSEKQSTYERVTLVQTTFGSNIERAGEDKTSQV